MVLYDNGSVRLNKYTGHYIPNNRIHIFSSAHGLFSERIIYQALKQVSTSARGQKLNTPFSQAQQYETRNQLQKKKGGENNKCGD